MKRTLAKIADGVFVVTLIAVIWSFVHQQSSGPRIGARVEPLTMLSLDGKPETLTPQGKPLLVAAFASWCGACKRSNTNLEALYEMGRDAPVDVVVVSVDESVTAAEAAVRGWPIRHRVLIDRDGAFSRAYSIEALPTYTLLNASGEVIDVHVGPAGAGTMRQWLNP